jgi:hypothetical protein
MKQNNLVVKDKWVNDLDSSIDAATAEIIKQISEDRQRAMNLYQELLSLFNQNKNSPEDIRELNKAQELVQSTTAQLQDVLTVLAKIKTGDARVQIAQINGAKEGITESFSRADLIDMLESIVEVDEDTSIDIPNKE